MKSTLVARHLASFAGLLVFIILAVGSVDTSTKSTSNSPRHAESSIQKENAWFQGGNLHKATLGEWKQATYKNKLATAGDWLSATVWKGHVNSPNDIEKLKIKAQMLVNAIDEVAKGKDSDFIDASEIAASLFVLSNDFNP